MTPTLGHPRVSCTRSLERLGLTRAIIRQLGPCFLNIRVIPESYLLVVCVLMSLTMVTPLLRTIQEPQSIFTGRMGHRPLKSVNAPLLIFIQWTVLAIARTATT